MCRAVVVALLQGDNLERFDRRPSHSSAISRAGLPASETALTLMAIERQSTVLPPAQPSYILRGHASQVHSVQFARQNTRLITGDADGWIVYWKVETKRALAVWKAHNGPILGTAAWAHDKIIT